MHLFFNCLAASAASGLTYVRNVVPHLSRRPELRATVALSPQLRNGLGSPSNISFIEKEIPAGAAGRFCWEQVLLPRMIRQRGAELGATEVHVHLLADNAKIGKLIEFDLRTGQVEADISRFAGHRAH